MKLCNGKITKNQGIFQVKPKKIKGKTDRCGLPCPFVLFNPPDRIMMDDFNAMCGNLEAGLEKTASDASKRSDQIQASADAAMAAANRAQQSAEASSGSSWDRTARPHSALRRGSER